MSVALPPPTSNYLDQDQRQRLVKSTRKLAGLLGEVPRVVEPEEISRLSSDSGYASSDSYYPYPRAHSSLGFNDGPTPRATSRASNRSARVFSSSRASFISFEDLSDSDEDDSPIELPKASLALTPTPLTPKSKKSAGPPLYLHLNTTNNSVLNITHQNSPTDNMRTPMPLSPLSPLPPTVISTMERRRQMAAKLARTLGENVPPELVAAPVGRPQGRSQSHEEPRSNSFFATQQEAALRQVHTRHPSNIYEVVNIHIPTSVAKYVATSEHVDSLGPLPQHGTGYSREGSSRRTGKEWSGEWNHDMQDVMSKLRGLK